MDTWTIEAATGPLVLAHSDNEYAVYDQQQSYGRWPMTEEGHRLATAAYGAHAHTPHSQKHTIVYTVTGTGTADITYDAFDNGNSGGAQDNGATLPWTKTITGSGLFNAYSVDATLGINGGTVSCTVSIDGKQVASHTSTGQFATVDCIGSAS
jgi:hypothetical protein